MYDVEKRGAIPKDVLALVMEELCVPVSPEELDEAMRVMDTDRSGLVELKEFTTYFDILESDITIAGDATNAAKTKRKMQLLKAELKARRFLSSLRQGSPSDLIIARRQLVWQARLTRLSARCGTASVSLPCRAAPCARRRVKQRASGRARRSAASTRRATRATRAASRVSSTRGSSSATASRAARRRMCCDGRRR